MHRLALAYLMLFVLWAVSACSSGTSVDPVSTQLPGTQDLTTPSISQSHSGHHLAGYYEVSIDPVGLTADVVPVRSLDWHLNAVKFLEPPNGEPLLSFTNIVVSGGNIVSLDVIMEHPFGNEDQFAAFDVKGILIGPGDTVDSVDGSCLWAGGTYGLKLLNADGYTRWWNPTDFPDNNTVFSYYEGMFGKQVTETELDSTICGYKVFASALEPYDDLTHLIQYQVSDPFGRSVFRNGDTVARHYIMQFPLDQYGNIDWAFNYAVDVSHTMPSGWTPGGDIEIPGSFPAVANQPEPFIVDVQVPYSNVYMTSEGCTGGTINMDIRISDWQALIENSPIPDQIESVQITSPTLFPGTREPGLVSPGSIDEPWAQYSIVLDGLEPDSIYNQQLFIKVVSTHGDYQPDVSSYTGDSSLTSYFVVPVTVIVNQPPFDPGFVLNSAAAWPKPGGDIFNSNRSSIIGPEDPVAAWEMNDLGYYGQPVTDHDGLIFLNRKFGDEITELAVVNRYGQPVTSNVLSPFQTNTDPVLVGCSLLWINSLDQYEYYVEQVWKDGSHETLFVPLMSANEEVYSSVTLDNQGHAFMSGLSAIQAFNESGELLWFKFGLMDQEVMFVTPITITTDGFAIVGKVDIGSTGPSNFQYWALNPHNGKVEWEHTTPVDIAWSGTVVDELNGQIYYTLPDRLVALGVDGEIRWQYPGEMDFQRTLAITESNYIYAVQEVTGQTGGLSKLVAITQNGAFAWEYPLLGNIISGPITDSVGNAYVLTLDDRVVCVTPWGDLKWSVQLEQTSTSYITFGPPGCILAGFNEPGYERGIVCLKDEE